MDFSITKIMMGFVYGLIFGLTSPIPGVSAGTVAILLNVYDKFFSNINMAAAKKNILSVISFLAGMVGGLLGISKIIMFLFDNHGQIIKFAFIGLIVGCLPSIYKKATAGKIEIKNSIIFLCAFTIMVFLAFWGGDLATNNTIEQFGDITPAILAWLFFASFVSSMAMLIPGVGGSLMLIVFGIYTVYLEAVSTLNVIILIVFVVSMGLGVLTGIVIIKKLLDFLSIQLYSAISGFIIGSLLIIYPGLSMNAEGLLSIVLACLCFKFAYWLSKKRMHKSNHDNKTAPE